MDTSPKQTGHVIENTNPSSYTHENDDDNETLIPGLPDELAMFCLAGYSLPPSLLFSISSSWRRFLYSSDFPAFFSLYALLLTTNYDLATAGNIGVEFFAYDPISATWRSLPPPPPSDPPLSLLHSHPSFLSRTLPIQSVAVSNHLVIVAATTHHFVPALSSPLIFHPESKQWFYGPPFSTPRRWCAAGSARGSVYVASGVGSHYRAEVARLMEEWRFEGGGRYRQSWKWEKKADLKDGKFCREAVEAIGYKGKLCMVNVKGNAHKEGAVYNLDADRWEKMPGGMISGWDGPAASRTDGEDEDELYVVGEVNGELRRYNDERECWEVVVESPEFRNAEQIAAGRGRVCIVCKGGRRIKVVDVTVRPANVWEVAPPPGMAAVAVHILPRMCR